MWFRHTDRRTSSLLSLSLLSAEERVLPQAAPYILGQQTSARYLRAGCQGFKEAKGTKRGVPPNANPGFHFDKSDLLLPTSTWDYLFSQLQRWAPPATFVDSRGVGKRQSRASHSPTRECKWRIRVVRRSLTQSRSQVQGLVSETASKVVASG